MIDEAAGEGAGRQGPARPPRTPLSQKAQDARRPPKPWELLEAEQDRPEMLPSKARVAPTLHVVRETPT
jgi:hypothetical protein